MRKYCKATLKVFFNKNFNNDKKNYLHDTFSNLKKSKLHFLNVNDV